MSEEENVPRALPGSALRWATVALLIPAWFALANHCVLGSIAESTASPEGEMSGCPMHSAPAKKKPEAKTPCCKEVRAIVTKCVTAGLPMELMASPEHATHVFATPVRATPEIEALDTGPPDYCSFAELVLQESLLSHAPPVS